jgi:serine/threonine-protein kinase
VTDAYEDPRAGHQTTEILAPAPLEEVEADIVRRHELDLLAAGTQLVHTKSFEIIEPLGEGGMGHIYKAYDPGMDRYVALKVLKPDVADRERQRFYREARIAADFSHPNLVRVLEVGQAGEVRWLAMEYLRGRDVGDVIGDRKQISFRVLVDIFSQALDALAYIHLRNIVHCDIKPENIFITRDLYDRRLVVVKVIDFGIARRSDGPLELQTHLFGDPRYMAPEQTIVNRRLDERADLYALGLTIYECAARRHPFEDHLDLPPTDLLDVQREIVPEPIARFMPRNTPPKLLSAFDSFLSRAVAKDPKARFRNATQMKEALVRLLALLE